MSALKSVLENSSSSKGDQDEAPVWKKILLIILSVLFLAASIIFVSPSVPGLLYASIVALVLFVLMYLHNRNRPMNKILHKPKNTQEGLVLWTIIIFYALFSRYVQWTIVGLAMSLLLISVYWLARDFRSDSNANDEL